MTIIGILAAIAVPALRDSPQRAREATLKEDLFTMRSVIDQYHGDKGYYPPDLPTLVSAGYIRKIPIDPMTKSADTWVTVTRRGSAGADSSGPTDPTVTPGIIDIHSGSTGQVARRHALQGLVVSCPSHPNERGGRGEGRGRDTLVAVVL